MRAVGIALCAALAAGVAQAAGDAAELTGRATIGTQERMPTLRLSCDPAGPGLSATLTVPRFEALAQRFDFDGLEGPAGSVALLTEIQVSGAGGVRGVRARASGSVSANPPTSFVLTVVGARRGEDPLRAIAAAMTEPGARITWTQGSPRTGDAPLVAAFAVGDTEAGPLKTLLTPCFGP